MVFQPTEGIDFSIVGLSALTQAMVEEGLVALVRKVYRKGTNPRLGILVPEDNNAGQRVSRGLHPDTLHGRPAALSVRSIVERQDGPNGRPACGYGRPHRQHDVARKI